MEGQQMSIENQAGRRKGERKIKRTAPEASLTGQPMPSHQSYHQVVMLIINRDIPAFDAGALCATLLLELEKEGEALSDAAYIAIMRVAACLKKQHADEVTSDIQAREVVRKARTG
jgi:hypothetical protein